eukprot:8242505-Ditylum_brightwellii.AAC.1
MTSDSPWNPHDLDYESREKSLREIATSEVSGMADLTDGEKTAIHYAPNRSVLEVNIADDNNLYIKLMLNSVKELLPDTDINSGV